MGRIINITNFNRYSGKYLRKNNKSIEDANGWTLWSSLLQRIPILAIRRMISDSNCPTEWVKGRNFQLAIENTLLTLKAWDAFRPIRIDNVREVLLNFVPQKLLSFQGLATKYRVKSAIKIPALSQKKYNKIIFRMADAVGYLSSVKTEVTPMLGSKIMNFLQPEFFPIWDTGWIKRALTIHNKKLDGTEWLDAEVLSEIKESKYPVSTKEYARYLALMFEDLYNTSQDDYDNLKTNFKNFSEIPAEVIDWFFFDIEPLIFERCLLGKYRDEIL